MVTTVGGLKLAIKIQLITLFFCWNEDAKYHYQVPEGECLVRPCHKDLLQSRQQVSLV